MFLAMTIFSAIGTIVSLAGSIVGCMGTCCARNQVIFHLAASFAVIFLTLGLLIGSIGNPAFRHSSRVKPVLSLFLFIFSRYSNLAQWWWFSSRLGPSPLCFTLPPSTLQRVTQSSTILHNNIPSTLHPSTRRPREREDTLEKRQYHPKHRRFCFIRSVN